MNFEQKNLKKIARRIKIEPCNINTPLRSVDEEVVSRFTYLRFQLRHLNYARIDNGKDRAIRTLIIFVM